MKPSKASVVAFKRMLLKYESSVEDLEYLQEMQSEVNSEFQSAIASLKRPDLFESKGAETLANEAKESEDVDSERDPLFKKLFRKVVIITHPDKLESDASSKVKAEMQNLYDRAVKANDTYNWAELVSVAIKLGIELSEDYHPYVEDLQRETDKIHEKIGTIENSIAWKWYHDVDNRDAILQAYVNHMEKILQGPKATEILILGVGHPRTGTGYTSKALQMWGLHVGHEVLKRDGIVAWQLAVKEGPWPFIDSLPALKPQFIIYNVRDPKTSIPSIVHTENTNRASLNFRIDSGVQRVQNRVEQAILSILHWDKLIKDRTGVFTYRIEDQLPEMYTFLKTKGVKIGEFQDPGVVNARQHQDLESLEIEMSKVRPSLRMRINDYCVRYGYDKMF